MWSLGVIIYIMLCGYPPFYGECERENCGWDQGKACPDCQENLFHRIQRGEFDFPDEEWGNISNEAKDLIVHLLVRNVRLRYTADDVLRHSWVKHGAAPTVLQTPSVLSRKESSREIQQMQEHFNVVNRYQHVTGNCLQLGSSGEESPVSSSGDETPTEMHSAPASPPDSHHIDDSKTPMPVVEELNGMLKQQTLADHPPHHQQLYPPVVYTQQPYYCSYPMVMVQPGMYMQQQGSVPMVQPVYYGQPGANNNICYYVYPPTDAVNA
jgi:serine/threonine protein kinase